MYAIIETGGKQYRVAQGDVIDVELLDAQVNGNVEFKHVLLVNSGGSVKVGAPHLTGYVVKADYLEEVKGPKVVAFKYKQRKPFRRKVGHRQRYARIKITEIKG